MEIIPRKIKILAFGSFGFTGNDIGDEINVKVVVLFFFIFVEWNVGKL